MQISPYSFGKCTNLKQHTSRQHEKTQSIESFRLSLYTWKIDLENVETLDNTLKHNTMWYTSKFFY